MAATVKRRSIPATSWCSPRARRTRPGSCSGRRQTRTRTGWPTDPTRSGATTCSTSARRWRDLGRKPTTRSPEDSRAQRLLPARNRTGMAARESGAGKSSLLGLLLRFAEPTSGQIMAGGTDLAAIPVTQWRQQLAWVSQRPYLFAGSVADNIALGAPGATPSAIRAAARLTGADDFIMALPFRYDTRLTEFGLTLSAGQRQRIALARAFLRDAPLVLLDEPTAHLDAVSAQQIMAAVDSLGAGWTVLLAGHRENAPIGSTRTIELHHGLVRAADAALPASPALPVRSSDPAGLVIGR